ncbi:PMS1 protein homolog 1-like [Neocloeon triangulifer]|uniref:PMS1 protein homolog 1-like n=1 Tax=Neocloeon triangulifer TaxID=2078957 RepID=UPI00286F3E99|nr:PMS1 protein homolog 1-like [Neocloeon triangulifer]
MADAVKFLDKNTARLITSNQVIQGPYNVVKELIENALDAGATAIDIRLENYGLEKITVKDNAKGISAADVEVMCKPGYSSKISDFSDLETVRTYGFRGEALASICCVANVTITTKTEHYSVATAYKFNSDGEIIEKSPSHLNQGTLICVQNLFHHQPARRRLLLNAKASANTQGFSKAGCISRIKSLLGALGVAWPFTRIFFIHGGSLVWKKQSVPIAAGEPIKTALGEYLGHNLVSNMQIVKSELDDWGTMTAVLPTRITSVNETCQSSKSAMILIVNKRVVRHKKIEDVLMEKFRARFPAIGRNRYPACVLEIKVNQEDLDVNLEPDKSKFLLRSETEEKLLEAIQNLLDRIYEVEEAEEKENDELIHPPPSKKPKVSESTSQDSLADSNSVLNTQSSSEDQKLSSSSSFTQDALLESSQTENEGGFKIEFFTPVTKEIDLPSTNDQNPEDLRNKTKINKPVLEVNLSEPSFGDESESILVENSLLATTKDDGDAESNLVENSLMASSKDGEDAEFTLVENSFLSTPKTDEDDDGQFVLSEEDEAALLELEKLICQPDIPVISQSESVTSQNNNEALPEFDQADWSRGFVTGQTGAEIEGSHVMVQSKTTAKQPKPKPESNDRRLALLASPCTQMGLSNLRAFNMFCKETRPKLLKEKPNMGLCEVAPLLARMWKDLPEADKQQYDVIAQDYKQSKMKTNGLNIESPLATSKKVQKRKPFEKEKPADASLCLSMLKTAAEKQSQSLSADHDSKIIKDNQESAPTVAKTQPVGGLEVEIISNENIPNLAIEETPQKSPAKKKNIVKTVEILVTLEDIMTKKSIRQGCVTRPFRVMGEWNGSWLVRNGSDYGVVNPWVLQEVLLMKTEQEASISGNHILDSQSEESPSNAKVISSLREMEVLIEKFLKLCSFEDKCLHGKDCIAIIKSDNSSQTSTCSSN